MTPRELEVVLLVKQGLSTKVMGAELDVSMRTIENHLRAVYAKAGVRSRAALLAMLLDAVSTRSVVISHATTDC
ncbi:helix-turn-helix transcriptional regulator [Paraburkholderia tropica]|nr:helix-turn-helix transcriptional regulator [Paraburkholderia tropica]